MKAKDRIIIVTGAGSGIGRALTLNLLSRGATVVAIDRNDISLDETRAMATAGADRLLTRTMDITDRQAVVALRTELMTKTSGVDGIINNAGIIQPFVPVSMLDDAVIERVMQVNFYGTLHMVRTFLPHLLTRPEAHIVNVSSMGGFLPVPGQTIYGASKAAVKLFTEGLHAELSDSTVRVTLVLPGAVDTNITRNSGIEMPKTDPSAPAMPMLSADKAAGMIVDAMEANRYRVLVGQDARFMDFIYRLHPERAARYIREKLKGLLAKS
jgi:short-subunit dehydrogenase